MTQLLKAPSKKTQNFNLGTTVTWNQGEVEVKPGYRLVGLLYRITGNVRWDGTAVLPGSGSAPFAFIASQMLALLQLFKLDQRHAKKRNPFAQLGFDRLRTLCRHQLGFAEEIPGWVAGFHLALPSSPVNNTLYPWMFDLPVPLGYVRALKNTPVSDLGMGPAQVGTLYSQILSSPAIRLPQWTGNSPGTGPLLDAACTCEAIPLVVQALTGKEEVFSYPAELRDYEFATSSSPASLGMDIGLPWWVAERSDPLNATPINQYNFQLGGEEVSDKLSPADAAEMVALSDPLEGAVGVTDDTVTTLYQVRPDQPLAQQRAGAPRIEWQIATQPFNPATALVQVYGLPIVSEAERNADLQALVDSERLRKARAAVGVWGTQVPAQWLAGQPVALLPLGQGEAALYAHLEVRPGAAGPTVAVPDAVAANARAQAKNSPNLREAVVNAVAAKVPGAATFADRGVAADAESTAAVRKALA